MQIEIDGRRRALSAVVGLVCVAGLVTLAAAGVQPTTQPLATFSHSEWVPPSMHAAEAGADIGPGSDEAQAASSPSPR